MGEEKHIGGIFFPYRLLRGMGFSLGSCFVLLSQQEHLSVDVIRWIAGLVCA